MRRPVHRYHLPAASNRWENFNEVFPINSTQAAVRRDAAVAGWILTARSPLSCRQHPAHEWLSYPAALFRSQAKASRGPYGVTRIPNGTVDAVSGCCQQPEGAS